MDVVHWKINFRIPSEDPVGRVATPDNTNTIRPLPGHSNLLPIVTPTGRVWVTGDQEPSLLFSFFHSEVQYNNVGVDLSRKLRRAVILGIRIYILVTIFGA